MFTYQAMQLLLFSAFVGVLRGMMSLVLEHPLDVIRIRWQLAARENLKSIIGGILIHKGVRGFYSGALPHVMRLIIKQAYRYPLMLILPVCYGALRGRGVLTSLLTGLTLAFMEILLITPLERLKVWLITSHQRTQNLRCFFTLNEGALLKELYRGLSAMAPRQILTWVVFMVTHDWLVAFAKMYVGKPVLTLTILAYISLIEGTIHSAVVLPFDCIKTHMQQGKAREATLKATGAHIYARDGIKGFYAGWWPTLIKYIIHALLTSTSLEGLRYTLHLMLA
jgi:hypothetical protein